MTETLWDFLDAEPDAITQVSADWRTWPVLGLQGLPKTTAAALDTIGIVTLGEVASLLRDDSPEAYDGRKALGSRAVAACRELIETLTGE